MGKITKKIASIAGKILGKNSSSKKDKSNAGSTLSKYGHQNKK